ncbi:hypothetical protein K9L97_04885 [Candidatus Woesearchaeota archaeon]|nr:hypothetical protein [Candidatus Woesearchaeota archaeon]
MPYKQAFCYGSIFSIKHIQNETITKDLCEKIRPEKEPFWIPDKSPKETTETIRIKCFEEAS